MLFLPTCSSAENVAVTSIWSSLQFPAVLLVQPCPKSNLQKAWNMDTLLNVKRVSTQHLRSNNQYDPLQGPYSLFVAGFCNFNREIYITCWHKKLALHRFSNGEIRLIMWKASMQGGSFQKSPHDMYNVSLGWNLCLKKIVQQIRSSVLLGYTPEVCLFDSRLRPKHGNASSICPPSKPLLALPFQGLGLRVSLWCTHKWAKVWHLYILGLCGVR